MCFIKDYNNPKIAKKDIVCYKTTEQLSRFKNGELKGFKSFNRLFFYVFGKKTKLNAMQLITWIKGKKEEVVEVGFHSFTNLKKAKQAAKGHERALKDIIKEIKNYVKQHAK